MRLREIVVGIKGAGEMASAVAWRLFMAQIQNIFMMEIDRPLAVRRGVCFCETIYEKSKIVEGVESVLARDAASMEDAWKSQKIPVVVDPGWNSIPWLSPHVVIDAILAKKNLGTRRDESALVIGLGPGFTAGIDVHMVIETLRGHDLGRILTEGSAAPDTGVPGNIGGFTVERVLRSPAVGVFRSEHKIGDRIRKGENVAEVNGGVIRAPLDGVIRGLIRPGTPVTKGIKVGDIDPRGRIEYCNTLSDKARAIAGSVLEAVFRVYNKD